MSPVGFEFNKLSFFIASLKVKSSHLRISVLTTLPGISVWKYLKYGYFTPRGQKCQGVMLPEIF